MTPLTTTRAEVTPAPAGRRPATGRRATAATGRRAAWLVVPALAPTVVVVVLGVGSALAQSLGLFPVIGAGEVTLQAYREVASTGAILDGLVVTLLVTAVSTTLALVVGFATAMVVQRSRAGGRFLGSLAAATVPIPHLVGAAAVGLLLADSGLVARILGSPAGTFPPLVAGPWWIAVIAEYAWKESAFVAVVVLGSLARRERDLDEAAAVLGAGPGQRLRRVSLPLAAPALVVAGSISAAYVIGSYEVAWLLGRTYPEPLPVLAFRLFADSDLTVRPQGLAVASLTVAIAAAVLVAGAALLRRVTVR